MSERARYETKEELLAAAAVACFTISEAQLARWHRAGLLSKPTVKSLGRGRGTTSLYPRGSAQRVVRLAEIHAQEHRLRHVAWRLWWEDGGALTVLARELLQQIAEDLDSTRTELISIVERDAAGDPEAVALVDELQRASQSDRLPEPLAEARRRVGKTRFPTVARIMLEVATNRFHGFEDDPETGEDDGALFEKSWGLERARTDKLASAGPWLDDDIGPSLAHLSHLIGTASLGELANASDENLDSARQELDASLTTISVAVQLLERLHGSGAFGYAAVLRLFDLSTPRAQATALLGWMTLRQDGGLREAMASFAGLRPQAEASQQLFEIASQMREEVPALAELLSPEQLGAAQLDADEDERLRSEIRVVAEANRSEVDAFLSRFPNLEALQRQASGEAS